MRGWPLQSICSLGIVSTGSTPKTSEEQFYGGDVPFVTPSELDEIVPIVTAPRTLSEAGAKEARLISEGAVMVCCIGSLGKVGIAGRTLATNQQINSVEFDTRLIWPKFGYYACRLLKTKLETMAPATTVPIVSKSKFEQLKIPVPQLSQQRRIADILDRADALRAKRRATLAQLDTLTQSIFLEMFGDPIANTKRWRVNRLKDTLLIPLRNGLSPSNNGKIVAKVLTLSAITGNNFDSNAWKTSTFHSSPQFEQTVDEKDFLICRGNGNIHLVGKGFFPTKHLPNVIFPDTIIAARVSSEWVNRSFLQQIWNSNAVRQQVEALARTTNGTFKLNQTMLEGITFIVPPISRQLEFARYAMFVEHLKIAHQLSLTKLEELFASLQYRAFRGEL